MPLIFINFTRNRINKNYLNIIYKRAIKVCKFKKEMKVSLVVVGERKIRSLNKKYRKVDKATDVLSFRYNIADKKFVEPRNDRLYLGEVFICYEYAKKQAKKNRHSVKKELAILLVHGIVHLAGYDHNDNYETSKMKSKEKDIIKGL